MSKETWRAPEQSTPLSAFRKAVTLWPELWQLVSKGPLRRTSNGAGRVTRRRFDALIHAEGIIRVVFRLDLRPLRNRRKSCAQCACEAQNEHPETLAGRRRCFGRRGFRRFKPKTYPMPARQFRRWKTDGRLWSAENSGKVVKRWAVRALARIASTERIFRSGHVGYAIMVVANPSLTER